MSDPDGDFDEEITEVESTVDVATASSHRPCIVTLTGSNAGQGYPLESRVTVIGRSPTADIRLLGAGISRMHCRIHVTDTEVVLENTKSTNGVIVNGQRVERVALCEGDKLALGRTTFRFTFVDDLEEAYQRRLFESALRDDLTSAYNKRYLRELLEVELRFARRHGIPLSVMVLDVDGLKRVNDQLGHDAGDELLRTFSASICATVRDHDTFARLGGDEFAICLRRADVGAARKLAARILHSVRARGFEFDGNEIAIGASVGMATYPEIDAQNGSELLGAADQALYRAKRAGGHRAEVATEDWSEESTGTRGPFDTGGGPSRT